MKTKQLIEIIEQSDVKNITTKHLCKLFGFNDGGKYIRRHLRKYFNQNHEWNGSWIWNVKHDEKILIEIIAYFNETVDVMNDKKRSQITSLNENHKPTL
jgi:hypothetical protein